MSTSTLALAIIEANARLERFSQDDLVNFAFDRLVDEHRKDSFLLKDSILAANESLAKWSQDDLVNFAFDRLVDEIKKEIKK